MLFYIIKIGMFDIIFVFLESPFYANNISPFLYIICGIPPLYLNIIVL